MQKTYRISQVYDIATAFITNSACAVEVTMKDHAIVYSFKQALNPVEIYTLIIYQPIGQAVRKELGVRDWEVDYKLGNIILTQGNNNPLMFAQTRHSVGKAADKHSSDVEKWLARVKSRKFFELVDMAKKRTRGEIKLTNNVSEIFNIVYRLKELQK